MRINRVDIFNYKSINYISFPLGEYDNSKTSILVGINESGKSNILEALDVVNNKYSDGDYEHYYNKLNIKASGNTQVNVRYYIELDNDFQVYIEIFKNKYDLPLELNEIICLKNILYVYRAVYFDEVQGVNDVINFKFNEEINWHHFFVTEYPDHKQIGQFIINNSSEFSVEDAESQLEQNEKLLTEKLFVALFVKEIYREIIDDFPKVIHWKPKAEHLISENISLDRFRLDPDISIPLNNLFKIYGCKDDREVRDTIDRALSNEEFKSELEDRLSEISTKHINEIWKEHKIKFRVKFDGNVCKVHVEDLSAKYKYHKMSNRSDGFKQFVSLILSLSAENKSKHLRNNLILLDEPEVHIHPSGIKYLRDEILKIGINNDVIVSTHSHYLVDTEFPARHWIVEKDKYTVIKQLNETANFSDDEVVSKAFGFQFMKQLIPNNVVLVEGLGDKEVFNHGLKSVTKKSLFTIKGAGGCSKVYSIASMFNDEEIKVIILVDDDDEGIKAKADIIKNLKPNYNSANVFTLRDIMPTLPKGATIEDLYPIDFINKEINESINSEPKLELEDDQPVIQQLRIAHKSYSGTSNKEKLEKLKTDLSIAFLKNYKTSKQIQENAERFYNFCLALNEKICTP